MFESKNGRESQKRKIEKPHETLRGRIEIEGRLIEVNFEMFEKVLKTACFFRHRFRIDFGVVSVSISDPKNVSFWYFQVRSGQVRAGQVRSGQVKVKVKVWAGQVRSGQVRSGQVKLG